MPGIFYLFILLPLHVSGNRLLIEQIRLLSFFTVKDTKQNNLLQFFKVKRESTQVTAKCKINAPYKRKPLQGTLAFEWFSFSRDV